MKTLTRHPFAANLSIHDLMEIVIVILNARDPYTFEHSWRVSALCEKVVSIMGIDHRWKETIHIAAHLHDIGKIGVPDLVLNKPEKLTSAEYEMVKAHPEIGYKIVNSIPQLDEIALYVRHHHERWDGLGYPRGLRGKDIPFGARIIAVSDTFDAITSSRPYRDGSSLDYALGQIEEFSGSQFCPEVSEAFLALKNEIPSILKNVNREIEARNLI